LNEFKIKKTLCNGKIIISFIGTAEKLKNPMKIQRKNRNIYNFIIHWGRWGIPPQSAAGPTPCW